MLPRIHTTDAFSIAFYGVCMIEVSNFDAFFVATGGRSWSFLNVNLKVFKPEK